MRLTVKAVVLLLPLLPAREAVRHPLPLRHKRALKAIPLARPTLKSRSTP